MRMWLVIAGIMGAEAIIAGAMSAHMSLPDYNHELIDKAVQYEIYHALALIGIAALLHQEKSRLLNTAGVFFVFGAIFFCGTLYMKGLWEMSMFPMSAPLGGTCFILGWIFLGIAGLKRARPHDA